MIVSKVVKGVLLFENLSRLGIARLIVMQRVLRLHRYFYLRRVKLKERIFYFTCSWWRFRLKFVNVISLNKGFE